MPKTLHATALLRQLLDYNPETGELTWRQRASHLFSSGVASRKWNTRWAGRPAFTSLTSFGYLQGSILNQKYAAHVVAWAMHYGDWPKHHIDHLNGIRYDNRIANLRDVPQSINVKNSAKSKRNTSGLCGVRWDKERKKWLAYGTSDRTMKNLGRFDCLAMAISARNNFNAENGFSARHGR